jgi:hypothetical protein
LLWGRNHNLQRGRRPLEGPTLRWEEFAAALRPSQLSRSTTRPWTITSSRRPRILAILIIREIPGEVYMHRSAHACASTKEMRMHVNVTDSMFAHSAPCLDGGRKSSLLGISLNQTPSTPQNASHSVNDQGPVICSGHAEINHFFYDENGKPRHDIGQRLPSTEMSRSRNGRTPRTPRDRRASMPQINRVSGSDTAGALGYHHEFISRTESDPSSEVSRPRKKVKHLRTPPPCHLLRTTPVLVSDDHMHGWLTTFQSRRQRPIQRLTGGGRA